MPIIENWLDDIPKTLKERVIANAQLYESNCKNLGIAAIESGVLWAQVAKVWASSRFVANWCTKHPEQFHDLIESRELFVNDHRSRFREILAAQVANIESEERLMTILRRFRNRQMVRIAFRDINGWAELTEVLEDITAVAETTLRVAHDYLYKKLCAQKDTPLLSSGQPQKLIVLGMGKLGALELNYSSDIDLIFAYSEDGVLSDRRKTTYTEFFSRLGRDLIKVIDTMTQDGFVFRVDMRLRPFGDSGPLVMSFNALESYYQQQARDWERYAMIKVRAVAGDLDGGEKLQLMLQPFVYRRYLDYGAFAALRELKVKITQELQRKERLENIKLGLGGIREIEFIGQAFQLIRGGREKELQERQIMRVLRILGKRSLLPQQTVEKLMNGYAFLRTVENRLQEYDDKQTHDLPQDQGGRDALVYALGFDNWQSFKETLDAKRNFIQGVFEQVFESPQLTDGEDSSDIVWAADDLSSELGEYLTSLGYRNPDAVFELIENFRHSYAVKALSAKGAAILDKLIPMIVIAVGALEQAVEILKRVLDLIEAIARRQVYLNLLAENPLALSQLVRLANASPWIISYIMKVPLLLDELLDPRQLYAPLSKPELENELSRKLSVPDLDFEQQLTELRHFKQSQVLRVAAADIAEAIPLMVVSDYLTNIAEVVLNQVVNVAWTRLSEKLGVPEGGLKDTVSGFGIIGYGKLGGIELGYGSDLDLVFLYNVDKGETLTDGPKPVTSVQFYTRLGQRIINILSAKLVSGILYEVDMRLRPSGNSGLLVSSINAFAEYQQTKAWTWEHQALIRARFIAGDPRIAEQFLKIRSAVVCRARESHKIKQKVREMREKMRETLALKNLELFDLKQGTGGIVDIEFLVQYLVLNHANLHPELVKYTDNIRLLDGLTAVGVLSTDESSLLKSAYCKYRDLCHELALQERKSVIANDTEREFRDRVRALWKEHFDG